MQYLKILFIIVLPILLFSCTKDENTEQGNPPKNYILRVSGLAKIDNCNVNAPSYNISMEFISDNQTIATKVHTGNSNQTIIESQVLSGNIIGVNIDLTDFNIQNPNSGRGSGLQNIFFKLIDVDTNEEIFESEDPQFLLICTDSFYSLIFIYDISNDTHTIEVERHDF